ncbi:SEC-C domain-containing protein [Nocardiopsis sp. RSe5-2]|uniref:SEC-C domain-containing protein n=1 Tax=Nocardiopsis endophytica TaxID=3018445 RepID=A0ABT4U5L5_9ACTN|nr:SEC-C domain-containing protein [Nocardiopsis endophytica]MDA2812235.1 SEC-C domain-containing protein [Nocardiopsis endophytica]
MARNQRPHTTSAEDARQLEIFAEERPEERADLLFEAAGMWSLSGDHDRAAEIFRLLSDPEIGSDFAGPAEAFRIGALYDAGRSDEADEEAARLRRRNPDDAEVWAIMGETYENRGDLRTAQEWFTAGITRTLGPAAPLTVEAIDECDDPAEVEHLIFGRARVRREADEPKDELDALAEVLGALNDAALDEEAAEDGGTLDAYDAFGFADEYDADGEGHRVPQEVGTLYWPKEQFGPLLKARPELAEQIGTDHAEYTANFEKMLSLLSAQGVQRLSVGRGDVAEFVRFLEERGISQADENVIADYGAELQRTGENTAWPPGRNNPCWCGSGRKYKKCCGNPAAR